MCCYRVTIIYLQYVEDTFHSEQNLFSSGMYAWTEYIRFTQADAEANSEVQYVDGEDVMYTNEYDYFINRGSGYEYVTEKMLKDIGWEGPMSQKDLDVMNAILESFGITSGPSIRMFFATMQAEGNGAVLEGGDAKYFLEHGYTENTRGAGYIQITGDDLHDNFLKYVVDNYSSGLYEKYVNLANTAVDVDGVWTWTSDTTDNDTATEIAENWAMTSAAWYWTGPTLYTYKEKEQRYTPENKKDLNLYAQGDNGMGTEYSETLGLFIITQYYVNGWTEPINGGLSERNSDYASVAEGGEYELIYNTDKTAINYVLINGRKYPAPDRLLERKDYYEMIEGAWGKNW